jgi:hypothetical protein
MYGETTLERLTSILGALGGLCMLSGTVVGLTFAGGQAAILAKTGDWPTLSFIDGVRRFLECLPLTQPERLSSILNAIQGEIPNTLNEHPALLLIGSGAMMLLPATFIKCYEIITRRIEREQ